MPSAVTHFTGGLLAQADRDVTPGFTRGPVSLGGLRASAVNLSALAWILRLATAGAFIGHGAYGAFMRKSGWYGFFEQLGLGPATVDDRSLMIWVGGARWRSA